MGNLLVSNRIFKNHNRIRYALLIWVFLAVAPATAVLAVAPAMAVDDDYLKALESENARLKKLVADQALDNAILKEAARGNF